VKKWLGITVVLLFCFLQYRLWWGTGSIQDVIRLKKNIANQKIELQNLIARNHQVELEIHSLKTDFNALEERARSDLGMIKENEVFCLVVEP